MHRWVAAENSMRNDSSSAPDFGWRDFCAGWSDKSINLIEISMNGRKENSRKSTWKSGWWREVNRSEWRKKFKSLRASLHRVTRGTSSLRHAKYRINVIYFTPSEQKIRQNVGEVDFNAANSGANGLKWWDFRRASQSLRRPPLPAPVLSQCVH